MKRTSCTNTPGRPLSQILESLLLDQRLAILDQVALQLRSLHERQQWYGVLGLDTVWLTDAGQVVLMPLEQCEHRRSLAQSLVLGVPFDEPCAAPEQYVQDALQPAGLWTDVYGYAALSWHLISGSPPPAAPWRQLSDPISWDEDANGRMQAILRGLSLDPAQRPQSMMSYARLQAMGEHSEQTAQEGADQMPPAFTMNRSRPGIWLAGAVLLVLAGMGYWFSGDPVPEPAVALAQADQAQPTPIVVASPPLVAPEPSAPLAEPLPEPPQQPIQEPAQGSAQEPVPEAEQTPPLVSAQQGEPAAMPGQASDAPAQPLRQGSLAETAQAEPSGVPDALAALALDVAPSMPDEPSAEPVEQLEPVQAKPAPPPAKGRVALDVRPWGEVYVNGRKQGVSPPLKTLSLTPGSYRIVVKNASLPEYSTTIRVRSGGTATLSHEFR